MAAGQGAFGAEADTAALDALGLRLRVQEAVRGQLRVDQLRTVLDVHRVHAGVGWALSTVPLVALSLGCSEPHAHGLLTDALGLAELPGALEALECGLLTVEQSTSVVARLAVLPLPERVDVWRRLQKRLIADADHGAVLPPARLSELLRRWVLQADPAGAAERRRRTEAGRCVEYRRRADGLGDLLAYGFRGPELQAVLSRIADRSAPWGAADDRTADQRRFDALKDLLLGRDPVTVQDSAGDAGPAPASACCPAGSAAPCGAELLVHVPLGTALGIGDDPAELVGFGPLEPDLLQELLLAGPRLRPVWVDELGTPVAVGRRAVSPTRGDQVAVREALLVLARQAPPAPQPRHPDDHPPDHGHRPDDPPLGDHSPDDPGARGPHPLDTAGPYRPSAQMRRLINARAPRCEWPGCGTRAVRCDAEHDVAWPAGPTCPCQLGPCCRRHHQVKQQGWTKARSTGAAVIWTSPGGRSWLSPSQHGPVAAAVRALPALPTADPLAELSPLHLEDELASLGLLPPDDQRRDDLHASRLVDREPDDVDHLGWRLTTGDTRWTLDLADPYLWGSEEPVDA